MNGINGLSGLRRRGVIRVVVAFVVTWGMLVPGVVLQQASPEAVAAAVEPTMLTDPAGSAGDNFGWAVDTDGHRVVVGAPYRDVFTPYVFLDIGSMSMFSGGDWAHEANLRCTNSNPLGDLYAHWFCGYAVAVEGDTTLLGAPQMPAENVLGDLVVYGAVVETDWSSEDPDHLFTYGYQSTSFYGAAVDMESGERILGAPQTRFWVEDPPVELVGEARILDAAWLEPSTIVAGLEFGRSVGVDGGLAVVGANGGAHVYSDAGGWAFVQEIARPTDDWVTVAIDDEVLVVGSRVESTAAGETGLAMVYAWNGSAFSEQQTLWPTDGGDGDWFGRAVAIDGDRIVIGAPHHGAGAAYVYEEVAGTWELETKLTAPSGEVDDRFGWSAAVDGSIVVVGAPRDDNAGGVDAGSAYVFDLEETPLPTTTTTTSSTTSTTSSPTTTTTTTTAPPTTTTTTIPPAPPPSSYDGTFSDDDGSVFEVDIEWLAASGITKGCNPPQNTMYCPGSPVTRGQMAAFLVRAMGYSDNGGGGLFDDTAGSVFAVDIDKLATAGVTKGCDPPENSMYCPGSPVTRGQMAAFLHRALG